MNFVIIRTGFWANIFSVFLLSLALSSCDMKGNVSGDYQVNIKLEAKNIKGADDIDKAIAIIKKRLADYGITEKNITAETKDNFINVEVRNVDSPGRIEKLIAVKGNLEFWETYEFSEVYKYLEEANKLLGELNENNKDLAAVEKKTSDQSLDTSSLIGKINASGSSDKNFEEYKKANPLFAYLQPALEQNGGKYNLSKGPSVGYCAIIDTGKVNAILKKEEIKKIFPRDLKFCWEVQAFDEKKSMLRLIAIHISQRDNMAPLDGSQVSDAQQNTGSDGGVEISIKMTAEGARIWKRLTRENIDKSIAIVIDDYVYAYPKVMAEIPDGNSQITGNFTVDEAKDMATLLKLGKLPCDVEIVDKKEIKIK